MPTNSRAVLGKSMRLIALTGYGREEDKQRTQAAGFDGHLIKSLNVNELQATLTNHQAVTLEHEHICSQGGCKRQ